MAQTAVSKFPQGGEEVHAHKLRTGDTTTYGKTVDDLEVIEYGRIVLVRYSNGENTWFRRDETVALASRGPE